MKKLKFFKKTIKQEEMIEEVRKPHIPFRLNLLFFVIFSLFVALIMRLGYLQVAQGEDYQARIASNSSLEIQTAVPRGQIYDKNGVLLVGNEPNLAITYTRAKKVYAEDILEIANKINALIDVPAEELTDRDKKDYWLADPAHLKAAQARLTAEDKKNEQGETITDESLLYGLTVEKVTPEEIQFDESTMKAATIFKRMNAVSELNTTFIKNENVTENEVAIIGEHTADIPGVSTGMDWKRAYPQGETLRSILGTVSSEKAGLPADELDDYLAKGYARNDRVGTSYLEKQYETFLKGNKETSKVVLDNNGKIITKTTVKAGEKGSNLKLTIDLNFQKRVEEIVQQQYLQLLSTGNANFSDGAYVVVMNPKTGAVLAMVAYDRDLATNELTLNPLGTINKVFEPGSVVKGATLSAGYETGVIAGNDTLIDEPIQIVGSKLKSSVFNPYVGRQLPLTAEQALEYSSNAYMMKLVFKMIGAEYQYNMMFPYRIGDDTVFNHLRHAFGEYGLGVSTGIDLPGESIGIKNTSFDDPDYAPNGGNLLDLSFGQYDTYTAMQLAQYISTVANGGTRVSAHLVEGIYDNQPDGSLGEVLSKIEPEVLNQVDISKEQLGIIQKGFHDVVYGVGAYTTGRTMADTVMEIAAKTGTAETSYKDASGVIHETVNSNAIAYAPFNDPEIAVSVIYPHLTSESSRPNQNTIKAIINAYHEMYKQGQ